MPTAPEPTEIAFYVPESPVEFLWAERLDGGLFRILTIPQWTQEAALDDVVETAEDSELRFVRVVRQSGHSTIRVWVKPGINAADFLAQLTELGCTHNPMADDHHYVLDVPGNVEITRVLDYLDDAQEADHSDWDVGSISDMHGAQLRAVMNPETLPSWVPRVAPPPT